MEIVVALGLEIRKYFKSFSKINIINEFLAQSSFVRKDSNIILSNVYKNNTTGIRDKIYIPMEKTLKRINKPRK